jgi:hypothetical protein
MGAPSGKLLDTSDLSAYVPITARERPGRKQRPAEKNDDPLRSPYAPKQAREHSAEKQPPVDLDGEDRLRPSHASNSGHTHAADELSPDQAFSDDDRRRFEPSFRWLREGEASRPPASASYRPYVGFDDKRETLIDGFRVPPSLAPERLQPLRRHGHDNLRWSPHILIASAIALIASAIAAPIIYNFSAGGLVPASEPVRGPKLMTFDSRFVAPLPMQTPRQDSQPNEMQTSNSAATSQTEIPSTQNATSAESMTALSKDGTLAVWPPSPSGAQASPASTAVGALDPEATKLLMKQGQQFAAAGDLIAARSAFQRAAEGGDATAALAMGATYDPIVLAKLGVRGIGPDKDKARSWYEKAKAFGSPEAARRLEILANR